jgi:predicted TIM-barrel fold metal-dependent hydrolase
VLVIDADTHIDETESTWEYLRPEEQQFAPVTLELAEPRGIVPGDARPHRMWQIAGRLMLRRYRDDRRTGTVRETRELLDIEARLRDMDRLGVDVQVLYPTLFLTKITGRPEVDVALCRSYNRWIAEATASSNGRLRWIAQLPLLDIDRSVEELRWAVDHGASGLLKHGLEAGGRNAADPYFFPVYEEAERLNVPVCFHTSIGDPEREIVRQVGLHPVETGFTAISAFEALVTNAVPDRFPKLRFGWIETSASWVPYLLHDLEAKRRRQTATLRFDLKRDLFRESRFYVTCDTLDDFDYLLRFGLEDSLMVGSDYSHADQSAEIDAVRIIRQKGERGDIPAVVADKIVSHNPARFYGL